MPLCMFDLFFSPYLSLFLDSTVLVRCNTGKKFPIGRNANDLTL